MSRRLAAAALLAAVLLAAAPALAGAELQERSWKDLVFQGLNLIILIGAVLYFARRPILDALAQRRDAIHRDIEGSAQLLGEAEGRLREWEQKTARLDSELAEIRETSRQVAEEEREKILAQARASAERIRHDAKAAVEQEVRRAREALGAEAAELAVELAGRLIAERVGPEDQARLFDEFVERIDAGAPPRRS